MSQNTCMYIYCLLDSIYIYISVTHLLVFYFDFLCIQPDREQHFIKLWITLIWNEEFFYSFNDLLQN